MWSLIPWKQNQQNTGGLTTAEPFEREFSRIRNDFDRLLHSMWSGLPAFDSNHLFDRALSLDIDETDTHYLAHIEAPGFEVGDFEVQAYGDRLVVKAEHKEESENGKQGRHYRYGKLQRYFALPAGAQAEQIEARYRNGVLELEIPKGEEAQKGKRITVKSA
jgi:HSP20 family protein